MVKLNRKIKVLLAVLVVTIFLAFASGSYFPQVVCQIVSTVFFVFVSFVMASAVIYLCFVIGGVLSDCCDYDEEM